MEWKDEEIELLTEHFHQASIGRFIVDVGWLPAHDPSGQFFCRVVLDENWLVPIEEFRTKDSEEMMRWVIKQMKEVARRGGNGVEPQDVR